MKSSTWTAADLPDLTGRTFVVTGAGAGLGLVTTRELARAGARVVMAVRDEARGLLVADGLRAQLSGRCGNSLHGSVGRVEVRHLDVSSLASVQRFADDWSGPLDVLINNAGIMRVPLSYTGDGLESQMATNYFGPFALTSALLPRLGDRVVHLSSQLHRVGHVRTDDLNSRARRYDELGAYCDSKLAVVLFSNELQRRLQATGSAVRSIAAHPGIARTNLATHAGGLTGRINHLGPLLNDVEHGALPSLYAATQDVPGGSYVGPDGLASVKGHPAVRRPSRRARDAVTARALWAATTEVVGPRFAFPL